MEHLFHLVLDVVGQVAEEVDAREFFQFVDGDGLVLAVGFCN